MQPVAEGERPAILSGWLYLPYEAIGGRAAREQMKASLTFRPRFTTADDPKTIRMFHDWTEREYLGVPRAWGINRFRGRLPLLDKQSEGAVITVPRLPDFDHPRCPDPIRQRAFHDALIDEFSRNRGFNAQAATGSGKTVVSLRVAGGFIQRRTLIMVHLERLMWQWVDEIKDKLGVDEGRIGIVQSNRCDWRGKDFVVGMMPSMAHHEYERDFYRAFGFLIYDEVHKVGTEYFAPVAYRFNARHWMGLSATMERSDGGEQVFLAHIGPIRVTSEADALAMDVYPMRSPVTVNQLWGKSRTARMKCLSTLPNRNRWLAGLVKRLYDAGRNPLIVSDYVEHIQTVMALAEQLGVPREAMGQYTGQKHGGKFCPVEMVMKPIPGSRPFTKLLPVMNSKGLPKQAREPGGGWYSMLEEFTDYPRRPVFGPVLNDDGRVTVSTQKVDIDDEELTHAKTQCQLTFATYGMVTEGIDEPRWDALLDLLPRGKAVQITGRVRRKKEGKKHPICVTPVDQACNYAMGMYRKRLGDYRSTKATIKEMA